MKYLMLMFFLVGCGANVQPNIVNNKDVTVRLLSEGLKDRVLVEQVSLSRSNYQTGKRQASLSLVNKKNKSISISLDSLWFDSNGNTIKTSAKQTKNLSLSAGESKFIYFQSPTGKAKKLDIHIKCSGGKC